MFSLLFAVTLTALLFAALAIAHYARALALVRAQLEVGRRLISEQQQIITLQSERLLRYADVHAQLKHAESTLKQVHRRSGDLETLSSLNQAWDLLHEKSAILREAIAIESDVSRKFQYEKQLAQVQAELDALVQHIEQLEATLLD